MIFFKFIVHCHRKNDDVPEATHGNPQGVSTTKVVKILGAYKGKLHLACLNMKNLFKHVS